MSKTVEIAGIGAVKLIKRRGSKHLKLRIAHSGDPVVSMPPWVPYYAAKAFAEKNVDWITKHLKPAPEYFDGQQIARTHRLVYLGVESSKPSVRLAGKDVRISIPDHLDPQSTDVQAAIKRGIKKAYIAEGGYLTNRLNELSRQNKVEFKTSRLKFMTSRWGSCSNDSIITLNYRLLDMPDDIIDYVIIHELSHTRHHNHSHNFWAQVEELMPDYKKPRAFLRSTAFRW